MRLVIQYEWGDGYTFSATATVPVNYESAESFLVDFEEFCRTRYDDDSISTPIFAGLEWNVSNFFEDGVYYSPTILTVDEWFGDTE